MRHRAERDSIFPYMAAVAYNYVHLLENYIVQGTHSHIHPLRIHKEEMMYALQRIYLKSIYA